MLSGCTFPAFIELVARGSRHGPHLFLHGVAPLILALCAGCSGENSASQRDTASVDRTDAADAARADTVVPGSSSIEIAAKVDRSEIGGESLSAFSSLDPERPVSPAGDVTLEVSTLGAHLVLIRDAQKRIRGLAISVPSDSSGDLSARHLQLDATSTATGLLMLAPGMTTGDPRPAAARLAQFRDLDAFPKLVSALRQQLGSHPLHEALEDPGVIQALQGAAEQWIAANAGLKNTASSPVPFNFWAEVTDARQPSKTKVLLKNTAPRRVNVYRRLINVHDKVVEVQPVSVGDLSMKGPSAFAVGRWTEAYDVVDLSPSRYIAQLEYWIAGIGMNPSSAPRPADLDPHYDANMHAAILGSFVDYIVGPMIWLIRGSWGSFDNQAIEAAYQLLKNQINLAQLYGATNPEQKRAAIQAACIRMLDLVIMVGALDGFFGLSAAVWGELSPWIRVMKMLIAAPKLIAVTTYWILLPELAVWRLKIDSPDPGTDITPPATISDLRLIGRTSTNVTLAWTMPGDDAWDERATRYQVGVSKTPIDASSWDNLPDLVKEPDPPAAGAAAVLTINGLDADTEYYFAIRVADEVPLWSGLSNVVSSEDTSQLLTTWKASFFADGPLNKVYECTVATPCQGPCPQSANLWLLGLRKSLNLPPIRVTETDGVIRGRMENVSGMFGTFELKNLTVTVEGVVHEGGKIDVTVGLDGDATYPINPGLLPVPASFSGELSLVGATRQQDRIVGDFLWTSSMLSLASGCTEFHYNEKNEGTATICINDCRCGSANCGGCIPAPGRCCCDG